MSNHPQLAGGSHLPDITVITPVFDSNEVVFFVASRGHHADIGGISPGSMPPTSTALAQARRRHRHPLASPSHSQFFTCPGIPQL